MKYFVPSSKRTGFCLSSRPVVTGSFVQIFFQALLSLHLNLKRSFLCILNVISSSFLAGTEQYLVFFLCVYVFKKYYSKPWSVGYGCFAVVFVWVAFTWSWFFIRTLPLQFLEIKIHIFLHFWFTLFSFSKLFGLHNSLGPGICFVLSFICAHCTNFF